MKVCISPADVLSPLLPSKENIRLNKKLRASGWFALAAFLCFVPLAIGQNTTTLTLVNGGSYAMDGIYVGPYNATENNQPVQIICDDFKDEVSPGQSWTARITSLSSLTNSTTGLVWSGATAGGALLGGTTYSLVQGYYAMAYLDSESLGLARNPSNATQIGYLAYAVWSIFDASGVYSWLKAENDLGIWTTIQNLAEGALKGTYTASEFAGWQILTPVCPGQGCANGPPQEFFQYVPEGGSAFMYLVLAAVSCFGAMFLRSRRRHAATIA
jgi:hypothetical protein